MSSKTLVCALAGLAGLAGPAFAADPVEPVQATGPNWTGVYIGVHGGVGAGNLAYTILPVLPGDATIPYEFADQQFIYGVHGGFDFQFARHWVGGLQLDYTQLSSEYDPFSSGGFGNLAEIESSYSISGRLGYLFTPETLVFARLGYAGVKLDTEEGLRGRAGETAGALLVGVGAETFLWRNLTGRVDVTYVDPGSDFVNADNESFDARNLFVTLGLSWRFGANERGREVQPAPEVDFNGFYVGVAGNYGFGQMHFDIDVPGATVGPFGEQSPGGGVYAGYDFRFGENWVAGIGAEASYVNYEFNDPSQNALDPTAPTLFATVHGAFGVTGRLGYVATPSTLTYVKGGLTGLVVEANEDFFALGGGGSKTLTAYQVGAGIETAITEHWTLKVEGLYTAAIDDFTVENSQLQQNTLKPSLVTGQVGLSYRF